MLMLQDKYMYVCADHYTANGHVASVSNYYDKRSSKADLISGVNLGSLPNKNMIL